MFDNVCKFLAENYSEDFAQWLLGYKVTLTELKPTELSLQPIGADSLILLESENLVLHLEFQTDTDETMSFRMIDRLSIEVVLVLILLRASIRTT